MARWQPDARGRLAEAAMTLYAERGFDGTTVADIAQRAGLTKRTFFRHFADKREVLFAGSEQLEAAMVAATTAAPARAAPLEAVAIGLQTAAREYFTGRRAFAAQRQAIVDAHPELQERELIKLSRLAGALAAALRDRGVRDPAAILAAEAGITAFRVAFERWLTTAGSDDLAALIADVLVDLRAVAAAT